MKRTLIALAIASLVSTTASAGVIHNREVRQQKRIAQGIASGELTPRETIRLERQQAGLRHEVADFREDNGGKLTRGEFARVERQQNRMSHEIYRLKHDGRW
jgi:hypothetical protein